MSSVSLSPGFIVSGSSSAQDPNLRSITPLPSSFTYSNLSCLPPGTYKIDLSTFFSPGPIRRTLSTPTTISNIQSMIPTPTSTPSSQRTFSFSRFSTPSPTLGLQRPISPASISIPVFPEEPKYFFSPLESAILQFVQQGGRDEVCEIKDKKICELLKNLTSSVHSVIDDFYLENIVMLFESIVRLVKDKLASSHFVSRLVDELISKKRVKEKDSKEVVSFVNVLNKYLAFPGSIVSNEEADKMNAELFHAIDNLKICLGDRGRRFGNMTAVLWNKIVMAKLAMNPPPRIED